MSTKCEGSNTGEDDELTRIALEELTKEAKRGKERSDTMGVAGWIKPQMRPNKRFLKNTLLGAARQRDAEKKKYHTEVKKSRSRGVSENFTSQELTGKRKEREQGEKSHEQHRHKSSKRHSSSENDRKISSKKKKRRTDDST